MTTRALTLLVAPCAFALVTAAQEIEQYRPITGETYEAVFTRVFPHPGTAVDEARFHITLRFLPPFAAECQIDLAYGIDRKAIAVLAAPSKPLGRTLNDFVAAGGAHDVAKMAMLVQVKTQRVEIEGAMAREWMKVFWRSLSAFSQVAPDTALKYDGTNKDYVILDPTLYQVLYGDNETNLQLTIPGPDPDTVSDLTKLNPIVRWMLDVRHQVEAIPTKAGRTEK